MSPLLATRASASVRSYGMFAPSGASAAFTSIATITATGGETSFTFSSIPTTYTDLQIRYSIISNADSPYMGFNGDSGANYAWQDLYATNVTGTIGIGNDTHMQIGGYYSGGVNGYPLFGIVDIHDYLSTSKNKTIKSISGISHNATSDEVDLISGTWLNTAAISSITITGNATTAGSTISLYGIKAVL